MRAKLSGVGLIYKITCVPTNKVYVGQTTWVLSARWRQHVHHALTGRKCALHNAIRKYGAAAFIVEELEECAVNELDERETYWIERLNSHVKGLGYNRTLGGQRGKLTEEVRAKLRQRTGTSNPMFGKHHSAAAKAKISATHLGVPAPQKARYGWKHSQATRDAMSARCKGRPNKYKGMKQPWASHEQTADTRAKIAATLRKFYEDKRAEHGPYVRPSRKRENLSKAEHAAKLVSGRTYYDKHRVRLLAKAKEKYKETTKGSRL